MVRTPFVLPSSATGGSHPGNPGLNDSRLLLMCKQSATDIKRAVGPRRRIRRTVVALFLQFQWVRRDGRNGIKFQWFWAYYAYNAGLYYRQFCEFAGQGRAVTWCTQRPIGVRPFMADGHTQLKPDEASGVVPKDDSRPEARKLRFPNIDDGTKRRNLTTSDADGSVIHVHGDVRVCVENVSLQFPKGKQILQVLDGLSFDVRNKEFVCLLGPSGCGKSTNP